MVWRMGQDVDSMVCLRKQYRETDKKQACEACNSSGWRTVVEQRLLNLER